MTILDQLQGILQESHKLTNSQFVSFMTFISALREPTPKLLLEIMQSDQRWIKILYNNMKAKQQALDTHDDQLWQRIVDDEEAILEKVAALNS